MTDTRKVIAVALIAAAMAIYLKNDMGQLKYPLDDADQQVLKQTIRKFLPDLVYEAVWEAFLYYHTFFDSLDGWASIGTPTISWQSVELPTAAVLDDEVSIAKEPIYQGTLTFDKPAKFKTAFQLDSVSAVDFYIGIGTFSVDGYGFSVENATLKGNVADLNGNTSIDLMTISAGVTYGIRAELLPNEKVLFYVDDVLKGVINANVPIGPFTKWLIASLITTDANAKSASLSFFEYIQKKDR